MKKIMPWKDRGVVIEIKGNDYKAAELLVKELDSWPSAPDRVVVTSRYTEVAVDECMLG